MGVCPTLLEAEKLTAQKVNEYLKPGLEGCIELLKRAEGKLSIFIRKYE